MRLLIEGLQGVVLMHQQNGRNALVPMDSSERTAAFSLLIGALALLAGVMPPESSVATEVATDEHCSESEQYHYDHTDDVVVPLTKLRDGQVRKSTPAQADRAGTDH
jgi:hypothetical protein